MPSHQNKMRERCAALLMCSFGTLWAQSPFQVHGYLQGRFTNQEGTPDRLEIRRARILFSGDPISKLSYSAQVDLAKKPYLMDFALTWKFAAALRVTAGQFKIPFSTESLTPDNLNIPIARARAVNGLTPGRDTGVQSRDTGIQLAGTLYRSSREPIAEYAAGVFRGQTLFYSPAAHFNAVSARVMLHPLREVTVGADWYGSFSAPARAEKRRQDAEAAYQHGRLLMRAEQIWARDGTLMRRGGYALGSWRLSQHWEPLARADWLTSNANKADTTSVAYLAGLNFHLRQYVKIGANAGGQHDQGPRGWSSLFLAQVMLGY